jgi:hypothetical protein
MLTGFSLTGAGALIVGALAVGSGVTAFATLKRV